MSKVIFYTPAYNAEKTLRRSVDSVLSQTHTDFTYYLLDNASTDGTREIINEYARQDKRIIPLYNEKNWIGNWFPDVVKGHDDEGYFCLLDADDEYVPDFLEKMLAFITDNNLDVATCGTDWIDDGTGKILRHKVPEKNIILEGQEFADQFPAYRNFMVTVWGGLFSLKVIRRCNLRWTINAFNFRDTCNCMEMFRHADRAGVLAESLHKYFIASETFSSSYNPNWFMACKTLMRVTREYLLDYGMISEQNENYLYVLHFILIKYILPRIQNSNVDLSEKMEIIRGIFDDDMTRYILNHWAEVGIYSDRDEFLRELIGWITSQNNYEKHLPVINRIIAAADSDVEEKA